MSLISQGNRMYVYLVKHQGRGVVKTRSSAEKALNDAYRYTGSRPKGSRAFRLAQETLWADVTMTIRGRTATCTVERRIAE